MHRLARREHADRARLRRLRAEASLPLKLPEEIAEQLEPEDGYRTIFDVGGSTGNFAEACHRRWPDARIYSFEPLRDVAAQNEAAAAGRWTTYAIGIAEKSGLRTMKRNLTSPEASTILEPGTIRHKAFGANDQHVRQDATFHTLDEMMSLIATPMRPLESPALLKIDVEGAEMLVLEGGRQAIPKFDVVVIEVNASSDCFIGAPAPHEVVEAMRELGFWLAWRTGELRDPRNGNLLQCDAIFKRL